MARLFIGTGVTQNYLHRAEGYLRSLERCSLEKFCITVGFEADTELASEYSHINFIPLQEERVQTLVPNRCLQHGDFLDALCDATDLSAEDVVIFTDSDATVQRDLLPEEKARLLAYGEHCIGVWWNDGPGETLRHEYGRLSPPAGFDINTVCEQVDYYHCYNTGFVAARPAVWRKINEHFAMEWPRLQPYFAHYAAQQWIMCWLIHRLHLHIDLLGYELHTHAHYPLPRECSWRDGWLYFGDKLIFMRHRV
jgi:hypothetical protein